MNRARPFLAVLLAIAPVAGAVAQPDRSSGSLGASSGASAAHEPVPGGAQLPPPPRANATSNAAKPFTAPKGRPSPYPAKPSSTGSIVDRAPLPLANVTILHIEVLPLQGDTEKCGLEAQALRTAAVYPVAASARLKVGQGTLTHMHIRLSSVYVRRLEHCILNADVRVSSLQQVELQHSKTAMPVYVPLWEKTDVRLVPRALAQKFAQDRLKQISEQLLIAWASQN